MSETLSYRALCSVADVQDVLKKSTLTQAETDRITRLINAASREIYKYTGREFVSYTNYADASATETRDFDVSLYGLGRNMIEVGDMQEVPSAITISDWNFHLVSTPTVATDVDCYPRNREEWEPVTYLRFRNGHSIGYYWGQANAGWPYGDYIVTVTSRWGFPSVPDDVRNGCIECVRFWWAQLFVQSPTTEPDATAAQPARNLPPHVRQSLDGWRRLKA